MTKTKKKRMTKREREEIEDNTKIKSIRIFCGRLKKSVVIPWSDCRINTANDPCGCCGSHGYKEVDVSCKCGLLHTIVIEHW